MFNLSTVFDTVASAVPDREALVWRDRRLTYRQLNERVTNLARYLAARGLGCRTERSALAGHESGQSHVGLYLRNGNEYLEGMVAAYRARVAPFNVNYRYVEEELLYLLHDARTEALIYHASFADQVAGLRDRLPHLKVLIQVADDSDSALLPGAIDYEAAIAAGAASDVPLPEVTGDDLYVLYTGGTTGMPKGVLWRQHDVYIAAMGGRTFGAEKPFGSYAEIAKAAVAADQVTMLQTAPFMHGAAQWSTFHMISAGSKVVLPADTARLDWPDVLRTVEREKVMTIPVVGDAMARPMADEIVKGDYDLSGLVAISNGGAPLTPATRSRLLEALPHIMILDVAGASETGIQVNQLSAAGSEAETGVFTPEGDTTVIDQGFTRELPPGDEEGWLARTGYIPLGYLGDEAKTARTFPVIDGRRYSVPGDRAVRLPDGRIRLLGRESTTINSGGEKIFAEEVERALAEHPGVQDVMVVPRPSERWGNEVVAVVALRDSAAVTDTELLDECGRHVARYKVPKAIVRRPVLQRSPSGKADYRWARQQADSGD